MTGPTRTASTWRSAAIGTIGAKALVNHMAYGCCEPGFGARRYFGREERKERLKAYQEALENELKGVKERLEEIDKEA